MKRHLHIILPPLVLALILSMIYLLPRKRELQPSAISPDLPLEEVQLGGRVWRGQERPASKEEREKLAKDTVFSKADYVRLRDLDEKPMPQVSVSIVYSGSDMSASIHRPERCLPSQGHVDIRTTNSDITLANGRTITFNRLTSRKVEKDKPGTHQEHICYYIFVGNHTIRTTHWDRTMQDMWDRVANGMAQSWAYYQVGTYWGGDTGVSEQEADDMLRDFISNLTPRLIDWGMLDD